MSVTESRELAGTDPLQHGTPALLASRAHALGSRERALAWLPVIAAIAGTTVGGLTLFANGADGAALPMLVLLTASIAAPAAYRARRTGRLARGEVVLVGLLVASIGLLAVLPEWLYGWQVNGILHRSAISGPLVLVLSVVSASYALRHAIGNTPGAEDVALYPVLAIPIALALIAYGLVIGAVVLSGFDKITPELLTTAWRQTLVQQNGTASFTYQVGLLNNILGTVELIILTSAIALVPGVAAGVFTSEYPGPLARLVDFSTTMLRAVSVFVIGAAAFALVAAASNVDAGTPLSDLIRGVYRDEDGLAHPGTGSFLTASVFLALLVMPIIAKLTEEGLRSVPREIREGSVALGATDGYGLRRILLPWAVLNIVTGLLLGAAEASGSLAVIMFIAGPGQDGVAPTNSVTSLDYALFATKYGIKPYVDTMGNYGYATALLLLVLTLGLTVIALLVRSRVARRYRGTLTGD